MGAEDNSGEPEGAAAHRATLLGRSKLPHVGAFEAPFHAEVQDYVVAAVAFAPEELSRFLHPSLKPVSQSTGIVAGYFAPTVIGGAPYAAAYIAAEIQGAASPDGSPGLAILAWCGTGETARIMSANSTNVSVGEVAVSTHDGVVTVQAQWPQGGRLSLSVRPRPSGQRAPSTGQHSYIETSPSGGLLCNVATYAAAYQIADVVGMTCTVQKSGLPLPALREVLWAAHSPWMKLTIGPDVPWSAPATLSTPSDLVADFIDLLARMGLTGALVGPNGRLLAASPAALPLVERLGGRDLARVGRGEVAALALPGETGILPVTARVQVVPPTLLGLAAQLVLFSTPAAVLSADLLLGLFGLTPAEARLAMAVGAGRGVEQAAVALGITVNTARSTLKLVFDKLGVSRQAELAALVARLK